MKRKVTAKVDYNGGHAPLRFNSPPRPASPTKQPLQSSLSPPGFRPTVKVTGSSNVTSVRRLSSSVSLNNINKVTHSRPESPLKPVRNSGPSIVTNPVKARVTARPASKSTTTSPVSSTSPLESRQRSSTTVVSKLRLPSEEDRPHSGSVVLRHGQSTSALQRNSPSPQIPLSFELPLVRVDQDRVSPSAPIKIKSKVSGLAKSNSIETDPGRSLSPPWVTTRPTHTRPPIPSLSSSLSLNAPPSPPDSTTVPTFYPITTAAPAANPHRYPSPRRGPSPTLNPYQTFTPPERPSKAARQVLKAKVDPASIPLPPHSPPVSALSLSSKSSVSRSSLSLHPSHPNAPTLNSHTNRSDTESARANNGRSIQNDQADTISPTPNDRQSSQDRDSDFDSENSEHKARAAAKSNRKIADLEITNKSLLVINASLETTKNRQAKEIRDLKRKLRESRLILPPRAFRAVESLAREEQEQEGEDGDSEEGEDGPDEAYARVKDMLEGLLESGRKALEKTPEDFRQGLSTKVLNADEVRSWRDSGQEFDAVLDGHSRGDTREIQATVHLSPSHVAVPDNSDDDLSEDEVERLTLEPNTPPPTRLPPIRIAPS